MALVNIASFLFIFIVGYIIIGYYCAVKHIVELEDIIDRCLHKESFYKEMIEMHGTSPTGAEYYVSLQDLMIQNKDVFDEAKSRKKNKWVWYAEMTVPFLVAWPHLISTENKIKSRG